MGEDKVQNNNVFRMNKTYFVTFLIFFIILLILTGWMILPALILIPILIIWIITYRTTTISLTETGVDLKTGWLHVTHKQIPFANINSVDVRTTFIRNTFFDGCGQVKIYTGNDIQGIGFGVIDRPLELKSQIESQIAKNKHSLTNSLPSNNHQQDSTADEIAKLAKLKEQGLLSEEEFEKQKSILLDR